MLNNSEKRVTLSSRYVFMLAIPMILSNITTPLVGIIDTAVVGRLGSPDYIGGVTIGAVIFSFLYWGFGFLRMGTTGFIARADGAGDKIEPSLIFIRASFLAVTIGLVIVVFNTVFINLALYFFKATASIELLTKTYASIRVYSAPATLLGYVITGVLIGLARTKHALYFQLFVNVSNVILNLFFVFGLNMGVAGVALATVIAEYLGVFYACFLLRNEIANAWQQRFHPLLLKRHCIINLMSTNWHIFVRTFCLVFSFSFFTAQSATLGPLALAANGILLHYQTLAAYALDGFAYVAETVCGREYGAKNKSRFKRAVFITSLWSFVFALLICLVYLAFGAIIASFFTNQTAILDYLSDYLWWAAALPLLSFYCFQLDGIFIGCGHSAQMKNAMLLSTFIFIISSLCLLNWFDNHGLWMALSLFMLLRSASLQYYYPYILRQITLPD